MIRRPPVFILGMVLAAAVVLCAAPFLGMTLISLPELLGNTSESRIFWDLRVPRVLLSFLAGMGLAVCGMIFQTVFRNPLATPYTLGVASGAAFGAAVGVTAGITLRIAGFNVIAIFAFAGAGLAVMIVYGLTRLKQVFSTATMLLAGVAVSFFFSSIILFIQYLSDFSDSYRIIRWLMGGIQTSGYSDVLSLIPFLLVGLGISTVFLHELNLLILGDDMAFSRGLNVVRSKKILFFAVSIMVGGIVAECGPIGFVGMMSPHICRLIIGHDHRHLFPATALFGGIFLTVCDTLARILMAPAEMPVGIITALIGGPFFLWLLLKNPVEKTMET